ncbi:hypothetical protein ABZT23_30320 [Streptomyces sp. NPDC005386]
MSAPTTTARVTVGRLVTPGIASGFEATEARSRQWISLPREAGAQG